MKTLFLRNLPIFFSCLCALLLFSVPAEASSPEITWTFAKAEAQADKSLIVTGILANNSPVTITHVNSFTLRFTYAGEPIKVDGKQPVALIRPLPPGGQVPFALPFPDPQGKPLKDITVDILSVETASAPQAVSASVSTPQAATGDDLKKISLRMESCKVEGDNYIVRALVFNNSDKAVATVKSRIVLEFPTGKPYDKERVATFKNSIQPNSWAWITHKVPHGGLQSSGQRVTLVGAEFVPAENPDRPYGPKKGNILWTPGKLSVEKDVLRLSSTLLNNSNEDIVAINTYTVTFDHDNGRQVAYKQNWTFENPIRAYKTKNLTIGLGKAVYSNPRNVKITDVTYMSRPAAKPAPAKAASSEQKKAPSSGQQRTTSDASAKVVKGAWSQKDNCLVLTVEILNNSSTQPLVRLDDPHLLYTQEWKYNSGHVYQKKDRRLNLNTMTVNIPPLGSKLLTVKLPSDVKHASGGRYRFTARFGQAVKSGSAQQVIIIRE